MKIVAPLRNNLGLLYGALTGVLLLTQSPMARGQAEATKTADVAPKQSMARLITVRKGNLPIIISAPHGGSLGIEGVPDRTGNGATKFVVVQDTNTDKLAAKLADAIEKRMMGKPYLVVAHFRRKQVDVNRPAKDGYESDGAKPIYDAYHQALKDATDAVKREWGGGLVLDIHGQAADSEAIFRGTNDGKTVLHLTMKFGKDAFTGPKSVVGYLAAHGYKILPASDSTDRENPNYSGGYIVQTYGSRDGGVIDAIQLETGSKLRNAANVDQTAADIADAVVAYAKAYLPQTPLQSAKPK
jgi:N-formylglutamate amidohydrolase